MPWKANEKVAIGLALVLLLDAMRKRLAPQNAAEAMGGLLVWEKILENLLFLIGAGTVRLLYIVSNMELFHSVGLHRFHSCKRCKILMVIGIRSNLGN